MPLNGNTATSPTTVSHVGSHGYYWTSSPVGEAAYDFFVSTSIFSSGFNSGADGHAVRCFMDGYLFGNGGYVTIYNKG